METWLFLVCSAFLLVAGAYLFAPRHLVFVVFLFMNWVVFFLVPFSRHLLDASSHAHGLGWPWLTVFCGFHMPLILLYLYFSGRGPDREPPEPDHVRRRGTLVYAVASVIFAAAFVVVVARNGLFYMRVGHELLAQVMLTMGLVEHAVLRLFIELLPLLLPANMLLFRIVRLNGFEKTCLAVFVLVGWLYILVNSRFDALVVILVFYILLVSVRPAGRSLLGGFLRFGILVVVMLLAVSYGRSVIVGASSDGAGRDDGIFSRSQWLDRIDGMSMIGDIHHGAPGKGFMWGAAWENAIKLNYYLVFDKPKYREIKLGLKTNPKVLIAEKYRGVEVADTPSSFLDDLYANFSVLGLLAGALAFAYVLCRASRVIQVGRLGSIMFFVAVWAVIRVLNTDNEFLSMLVAFAKFLPLVVVFAALYPAQAVFVRSAAPAGADDSP